MKTKRRSWLWTLLFICVSVSALGGFPPRDEAIFQKNCLRLLENGQYTFLTEYFQKYYPLVGAQSKAFAYLEEVLLRLPLWSLKKKILKTYFENAVAPSSQAYLLKGELALFAKDYETAAQAFRNTKSWKKYFYLGKVERERENFSAAVRFLLRFLEEQATREQATKKAWFSEAHFLLAESHYFQGEWLKGGLALRAVEPSAEKYVLRYFLEKKSGQLKRAARTLALIKKSYAQTLTGSTFLESQLPEVPKRKQEKR